MPFLSDRTFEELTAAAAKGKADSQAALRFKQHFDRQYFDYEEWMMSREHATQDPCEAILRKLYTAIRHATYPDAVALLSDWCRQALVFTVPQALEKALQHRSDQADSEAAYAAKHFPLLKGPHDAEPTPAPDLAAAGH